MFFHIKIEKKYTKSNPKYSPNVNLLHEMGCNICPLNDAELMNPKMDPSGSNNPLLYILGESPSKIDDEEKGHFLGSGGDLLWDSLEKEFGIDFVKQDVRWNNVIKCRPIKKTQTSSITRVPILSEIEACRKYIEDDINKVKPYAIIGVGTLPLEWALKGSAQIVSWRGRRFPVRIGKHECWFFSIYKPEYVIKADLKSHGDVNRMKGVFLQDIKKVKKYIFSDKFFEASVQKANYYDATDYVLGNKEQDYLKVKSVLKRFLGSEKLSLDIENYPLKPYSKDSKLVSVAISNGSESFAFPLEHPDAWKGNYKRILGIFEDFVLKSQIKICHNLTHEFEWMLWYFGKQVLFDTKWADTMAQAYVLDERKRFHNLDVLCRLHFGFSLKSLNKVNLKDTRKVPVFQLMKYNVLDAKYTYKLYEAQEALLDRDLFQVIDYHVITSRTIALTQNKGLVVDRKKVKEYDKKFSDEIISIRGMIEELPEVDDFEKIGHKKFDCNSNIHISGVLQGMELASKKKTKTGKFSTDQEVLEIFAKEEITFAKLILKLRKVSKQKSTYISGILEKISLGDRLRPTFNSMFTSTGRLSSENPNMQNFPKRTYKEVRSIIIPYTGDWFVANDYGQLEGRIIAITSKDESYCRSIKNGYDIHMHWAKRIAEIEPSSVGARDKQELSEWDGKRWAEVRYNVKNKWVFPLFYGSKLYSVQSSMNLSKESAEFLYDEFWTTFSGVKNWQKELFNFYTKFGYVEGITGRRRRGPLNYNQIINSPIQGTAAEMAVKAMNRLSKIAYSERKPQYQAVLNIHDDLVFSIPNKTLDNDIEIIAKEMARNPFKGSDVPFSIETSVGKNWADMEEICISSTDQFSY